MASWIERYILHRRVVSFESELPPEIVIERVRQKTIGWMESGPSFAMKPLCGNIKDGEFHGTVRFPTGADFGTNVSAEFLANGSGTTVHMVLHGSMLLILGSWLLLGIVSVFVAYELFKQELNEKTFVFGMFILAFALGLSAQSGNLDEFTAKTKETFVSILL